MSPTNSPTTTSTARVMPTTTVAVLRRDDVGGTAGGRHHRAPSHHARHPATTGEGYQPGGTFDVPAAPDSPKPSPAGRGTPWSMRFSVAPRTPRHVPGRSG